MPHLADRDLPDSPLNMRDWVISPDGSLQTGLPRRRGIVIYGAGLGHEYAPLEDGQWEVWGLNVIPPIDSKGQLRADRWFEMHQRHAQSDDDMRWIAQCPCPIYVPSDLLNASPNAVTYPLERMEALFGGGYWTCTFAYQIALALSEGYRNIGLFGVELSWGTARERTVEYACVSWWMGMAQGMGAKIYVPRGSMLGRHRYRYGLEYDEEKTYVEKYLAQLNATWLTGHGGGMGG